ncbi:hypothetical protein LZC95_19090 [Pendulispora brunnea]|uniref:Uncharacterized protein n=1 Tax=Pendulispora brunnea TaxID=2905690 RepID=A0ABZ2KPC6_9BACT
MERNTPERRARCQAFLPAPNVGECAGELVFIDEPCCKTAVGERAKVMTCGRRCDVVVMNEFNIRKMRSVRVRDVILVAGAISISSQPTDQK